MNDSPVRTSAETDKIDAAMAKAQADLENPVKTKTAQMKGTSKAGRDYEIGYAYADIADILADCRPILAGHGIALYQPTVMAGGALYVVTRLACEGQWIEGDYPVCHIGGDHQEMGKAVTYARRYALGAMIGIAPEKDADGQGAARSGAPRDPLTERARAERSPQADDFPGDRDAPRKSSAQAKKDGDWERYTAELKAQRTVAELKKWAKVVGPTVRSWPKKWQEELMGLYEDRKAELEGQEGGAGMDRAYRETV